MSDNTQNNTNKRKSMACRSWVWQYFVYNKDQTKHLCLLCSEYIEAYSPSTCHLGRHLRTVHKIEKGSNHEPLNVVSRIDMETSDEYSSTEDENEDPQSGQKKRLSEKKRRAIDKAIMEFFTNNNLGSLGISI